MKGNITKQEEEAVKNKKDNDSLLHIYRQESQSNKFKDSSKNNFFAMTL
ncbi:MAG TPA: hypothetical protein VFR94_15680 [Nitrososphaeraceae archaeon]|nr:hypothetical protein [Nitrososphaeraceae archaeon]